MRNAVYKSAKLAIYEKHDAGEITEAQRDELFTMLEAQKESTDLTPEKISDFFDELSEKYPDNADDIKKLSDKLAKAGDDGEESSEDEGEVKESVRELMAMIESL